MALNVVDVQDLIIGFLETALPYEVVEQGVPDASTVKKVNGKVVPYIATDAGTLSPRARGRTFVGARTYDYDLVIRVQVVAGTSRLARQIFYGAVLDALTGAEFPWTGQFIPSRVGGIFPIISSNGATEAYQYASSFSATIQMADV
jgi:hypothetical protein